MVNGSEVQLSNSSYTTTMNEQTTINVIFEDWTEFEIYMYQTEELYKLAQQVVNGTI